MSTPNGVTITATAPDGSTVDVTEGVQALYDAVIHSLDWGSQFFTVEDAVPIARIARICGFQGAEEAERYLREAEREAEKVEALQKLTREGVPHHEAHLRVYGEPQ